MRLGRLARAYPTLLRVGLAEAVAYRAEFLVWVLTMTMPLVMLALMLAVSEGAPVGRFDHGGFVAYYLATLIVRQMTGSWVVWELVREIREGTLSLKLLRPMHPLAAYSAESLAAIPMRAVISLPLAVLLLSTSGGPHLVRTPAQLAAFAASLVGAWLLNFSISAIVGTLGLYLESSIAVWELWLGCFMIFSGYLLPLELFPRWLERLARLSPFAYLQALPTELLTGLASPRGLIIQWAYAIFAFCAMLLIWRRAVRRFAAFGG
jgi:ABC-2 type transport system permease protein